MIQWYLLGNLLFVLIKIWEEMFSTQLSDILSVKQCPIRIGVMRRSPGEEDWLLISEYEFKLLFKDYTLVLTEEKLTRETFLRVLIIFKEECDDNEQLLWFIFHCLFVIIFILVI